MSSSAALTEPVTIKKLFKWTIPKFNEFDASNMKLDVKVTQYYRKYKSESFHVIQSPKMAAFDPYNGKEYTATIQVKFKEVHGAFNVVPDVTSSASDTCDKFQYYFTFNDDPEEKSFSRYTDIPWNDNIKKLTIFIDLSGNRSLLVSPFKKANHKSGVDHLKQLWKNDSSVKFTIKSGEKSFDTFKPFLAANSFFFKDMFESGMTQNFLEITDFEAEAVQKMVEFCETNDIKDYKGYEDQLFKIAHKFQVPDLMDFAVEKMSENADSTNIFGYLQLATDYKLKDFEEWCMQFAFRAKVNVK